MKIDIADVAENELAAAYDYYFEIEPNLAERFLRDYRATLELILNQPETWLVIEGKLHRKSLADFPYAVVYEIHSVDHLTIISIFHLRREPGRFPKRDL